MHELSIVMSIIDIAASESEKHQRPVIEKIELDIGDLAGIERSALDFAWSAAIPGSILDGAELIIHDIRGEKRCLECDQTYTVKQLYDACPHCQSFFGEILSGKELRIRALTFK
jgi:hydrogenase nickel incorporation protein HypA/HybF